MFYEQLCHSCVYLAGCCCAGNSFCACGVLTAHASYTYSMRSNAGGTRMYLARCFCPGLQSIRPTPRQTRLMRSKATGSCTSFQQDVSALFRVWCAFWSLQFILSSLSRTIVWQVVLLMRLPLLAPQPPFAFHKWIGLQWSFSAA